ncbi:putative cAMP receptor-like protein [Leptodontidium sp. MPI-SDFR-AT-0119]|nr:putative cAMP receptor-like protein [Leptodontidium sp. MPI-SDFR-AT-0119]
MGQNHLTDSQIHILVIIEKTSAVLSLIGTTLIITTFLSIKSFRKLSTTLIFYASFSNVLSNVAHLVGVAGIRAGRNSALCQVQAFLQQAFMPADVLWSLAMAINVYLTFFRQYNAASLTRLSWKYFIICYGLPFVPAVACLFIGSKDRGRIYGNATLWCRISTDWATLRVTTFYAPIWTAMLTTIVIYILVGNMIFKKRREIRSLYSRDKYLNTRNNMPFSGIKTTEVQISSSIQQGRGSFGSSACNSLPPLNTAAREDQYSITILGVPHLLTLVMQRACMRASDSRLGLGGLDSTTWAYTQCAALFAASLLITWVPSSANRVYSLLSVGKVSYPLNILSAMVLPLQGFWNSIIYFTTLRRVCRAAWDSRLSMRSNKRHIRLNSIVSKDQGPEGMIEFSTDVPSRSS